MGVAKDFVAAISNLAYWMAKERSEDSLRELRKLRDLLPEPAREEAEEVFDAMEMLIREGQFDDSWEQYEVLADIVVKYIEDPPLTTWLPEETYEGYEKASKVVGETKSRFAREVLEGRRTPVEPPDGVRARERAEKIAKVVRKADWEEVIEEAERPIEADWEKVLKEAEREVESDWEKTIREVGGESNSEEEGAWLPLWKPKK